MLWRCASPTNLQVWVQSCSLAHGYIRAVALYRFNALYLQAENTCLTPCRLPHQHRLCFNPSDYLLPLIDHSHAQIAP